MSEGDLISVIVPIYKVEKYLSKCVKSILAQTYTNIEVILVDDGSPDNCGRIADTYAARDKRVRVIHKPNGGLSSARNAGIDIAGGAYIGFVDSDDYIHPDMYKNLYTAIKAADAEISICNYCWMNENGTLCEKELSSDKITTGVLSYNAVFAAMHERSNVTYITAYNKLYKSSLLHTVRFPEGKIHEDEFTVHHFFAQCNKVACISDVLYYYVQREGGLTSHFSLKNFDRFEALLDRYRFYRGIGYQTLAVKVLGGSIYDLLQTAKKIRGWVMLARWTRLMIEHFLLMLGDLQVCCYIAKKFVGKVAAFTKRYLTWRIVKCTFFKTTGLERRVILTATPEHGNLGDQAIVYAERQLLAHCMPNDNVVEIPNSVYLKYRQQIQQFVRPQDLIVIDGGGNMGTLWTNEDDKIADIIFRFRENKIIIFPQTCYYGDNSEMRLERNRDIYANAPRLTLTFRDKASFDFARANFPDNRCEYLPDIVISVKDAPRKKVRKGVLLCFRRDHEKVIEENTVEEIKSYLRNSGISYAETDTVIRRGVSARSRNMALHSKWLHFGSAGLVVTDRLHGMIFAAITGTPCIAMDNISRKVSGVYAWIKELPYIRVLDKTSDIVESITDMYCTEGAEYVFDYPHFFEEEIRQWLT